MSGKTSPFPNRPDHDDFRLLSKVVREHDDRSDQGNSLTEIVSEFIDLNSLGYMADQRCKAMGERLDVAKVNPVRLMKAAWFDAFMAGVDFQKRKEA